MKPLIDVHYHTVASGHAFSTLQEMAAEASRQGTADMDFEPLVRASRDTGTLLETDFPQELLLNY